jgi:hypothetical protein
MPAQLIVECLDALQDVLFRFLTGAVMTIVDR